MTMLSLIPMIQQIKIRSTSNAIQMALNTIYNAIDSKVFEQIKDCDTYGRDWKKHMRAHQR